MLSEEMLISLPCRHVVGKKLTIRLRSLFVPNSSFCPIMLKRDIIKTSLVFLNESLTYNIDYIYFINEIRKENISQTY